MVAAAAPRALNVATGTAGAVGMAGLTMGGGYGPLLGTYGLAADNLLGARVVLADGRVVSTDEDPELLWALRGGGGNFGVVTSMQIRLHPDRGLLGGVVVFEGDQSEVLGRYADLLAGGPEELPTLMEMTEMPGLGPCLLGVPVWSGAPDEAQAAMDAVIGLGRAVSAPVGPTTQQQLLAQFDQQIPTGMHWTLRTRTIATLTDELIDLLLAAPRDRPGPGCGIGIRQFHGAATRRGPEDSAFGRREEHLVVEISAGRAPDDDHHHAHRSWAETLHAGLAPHALPGGYPNFLTADRTDQVAHAYGPGRSRLMAAKAAYDPTGVFTATPCHRPGRSSATRPA